MKPFIYCAAMIALTAALSACTSSQPHTDKTASVPVAATGQQPRAKVIAYYMGDGSDLARYDFNQLTHIIYSFLHLQGNQLGFDSAQDQQAMRNLVALKRDYPHLKVLLSLGGWGGCETCSDVFHLPANRSEFAQSTLKLIREYGADGIDLDWEYPTIAGFPGHKYAPYDRDNFSALVNELRQALGADYELSFAAGGFNHYLDTAVDWPRIMPLLDNVNLMTYDIVNGGTPHTGHHTALYSTAQQQDSTDNAVQYLLRLGVPAEKIVIGAAFYARTWKDVGPTNNGLYQPGVHVEGAGFRDFAQKFALQDGYEYHWDPEAKAPFYYNKAQRIFVTFDDAQSLREKVNYLKHHQLGGIMFWQLPNDSEGQGLLHAIHQSLASEKITKKH